MTNFPPRRPGVYAVRTYPPYFGPPEVVCMHDISHAKEEMAIRAINNIDQERPSPFVYVTRMKYSNQFVQTTPRGCNCIVKCELDKRCMCVRRNEGEKIPYNRDGTAITATPMLYECGPSCSCPLSCSTRVSQFGIRLKLEVFKTKSKGWGVRSPNSITLGSFICEYLGELLEKDEADLRDNEEYLFKIGDKDCKGRVRGTESDLGFTIDAKEYGNVSRFINHSCSPNVYAQDVVFDNADTRVPHVMFFASRFICPKEELTFDYNYKIDTVFDLDGNILKKDCHCGSLECRGRMY